MGGVRDDGGSYRNLFARSHGDGAAEGDGYEDARSDVYDSAEAEAEILARGRTNRITLPEAGIASATSAMQSSWAPPRVPSWVPNHGAVVRDPYDHPAIGKLIAGRYLIERLIGVGGMADVFEAHHAELGRRVAVKVVSPCLDVRGDVALRLKREAAAAAALESDHVVEILDVGEDRVLGIYVVMELLRGEDLARMVKSRGRLDAITACGIALQACLALERAHAAGIFHRDLKPSNTFLTEGDDGSLCVKLVDFGLAKVLRDANGASHGGITRTGTVVGTPQYMAPELARGESVDQRADLYSLGAVLYECLTGRPPVDAKGTYEETLFEVTSRPRTLLTDEIDEPGHGSATGLDVPRELAMLVDEMMAFDPDMRVAQAVAVRRRIVGLYPHLGTPLLSLSPFALAPRSVDALPDSARASRLARSVPPAEGAGPGEGDVTFATGPRALVRRARRALGAPGLAPLALFAFGALFVANVIVLVLNVQNGQATSRVLTPTAAHPNGVPEALSEIPSPPPAVEADAGGPRGGMLRDR